MFVCISDICSILKLFNSHGTFLQNKQAAEAAVTAAAATATITAAATATSTAKTEKAVATFAFDKTAYTKEQSAIAKKWEEYFKTDNFNQSTLSLLDLYTHVSQHFRKIKLF